MSSIFGHDPVSAALHLGGALVFLALAPDLISRGRGKPRHLRGLWVFFFAVELQLWASGLYHVQPVGEARALAQKLDHAGIFLLIAGTFTPCHFILFRGFMRNGVLAFVWIFALGGLVMKTLWFDDVPEGLGLVLYLGLGWVGLLSGLVAIRLYGFRFTAPVLWGGLAYTIGATLEFARWPTLWPGAIGPHEVFHVFVLAGITFHWRFIRRIAGRDVL